MPEEGLGLLLVCLFRYGQEIGHCESLNSLPQEPVPICELSVFLQLYSSAHLLLLTLTFYRILSSCPLLGVNTEERKKEESSHVQPRDFLTSFSNCFKIFNVVFCILKCRSILIL